MAMAQAPFASDTRASAATLDVVRALCGEIRDVDFAVRLWDGTNWSPDPSRTPRLTLVVRSPAALRRLIRPGSEIALAEAYLSNELDVEGDIFAAPALAAQLLKTHRSWRDKASLAWRIARLPKAFTPPARASSPDTPVPDLPGARHSTRRDRAAIRHHYDVSNRFYELFLDPAMVYTCAFFEDAGEDLASAQRRKLDLVCRKLRLRPGDRMLDVGCGWGALSMHAAREYGADATGFTLSEAQASLAQQRIREAGLESTCRVHARDYRDIPDDTAFDCIASIGVFEHVGRAKGPDFFNRIVRLLRPGGVYLHHAVNFTPRGYTPSRKPTLTNHFVFPENEVVLLDEAVSMGEAAGLETRDVENLREHYALTLRHWVDRMEQNKDEAVREVGETTWRAWRMVFAGAAVRFETGLSSLNHILFVKPHSDGSARLPLSRKDWYAAS
jgi:cyclopropane-fatty-acyl-phospholipid synthase